SVHGMGNIVMKKVIKYKQAVSSFGRRAFIQHLLKKTAEAAICDISGNVKDFTGSEVTDEVLTILDLDCHKDLR
ncbi:hypothetical protein ACJMK2_032529, partial [Sinanodonta woodiana]